MGKLRLILLEMRDMSIRNSCKGSISHAERKMERELISQVKELQIVTSTPICVWKDMDMCISKIAQEMLL